MFRLCMLVHELRTRSAFTQRIAHIYEMNRLWVVHRSFLLLLFFFMFQRFYIVTKNSSKSNHLKYKELQFFLFRSLFKYIFDSYVVRSPVALQYKTLSNRQRMLCKAFRIKMLSLHVMGGEIHLST